MLIKESIEKHIESIKKAAQNAGNTDTLKGKVVFDLLNNQSSATDNPKSLNNDFELLDISDRANTVYQDAIVFYNSDGVASIKLPASVETKLQNNANKFENKPSIDNLVEIIKTCYNAGLHLYQFIAALFEDEEIRFMESSDFKEFIKEILSIKIPISNQQPVTCDAEQITVNNGASANTFVPQLEQQPQIHQAGYNVNDVINNINNSVYSPLDNAVKWLTNNVKFGGQIDKQEAINLYNIFNWQPFVAQVSQYYPVKDGNKRLWFRLPDYEFDKNMYKYAFGAFSGMYQDKRIIFLCNPNTGAFTTYLVNASDVATK